MHPGGRLCLFKAAQLAVASIALAGLPHPKLESRDCSAVLSALTLLAAVLRCLM